MPTEVTGLETTASAHHKQWEKPDSIPVLLATGASGCPVLTFNLGRTMASGQCEGIFRNSRHCRKGFSPAGLLPRLRHQPGAVAGKDPACSGQPDRRCGDQEGSQAATQLTSLQVLWRTPTAGWFSERLVGWWSCKGTWGASWGSTTQGVFRGTGFHRVLNRPWVWELLSLTGFSRAFRVALLRVLIC